MIRQTPEDHENQLRVMRIWYRFVSHGRYGDLHEMPMLCPYDFWVDWDDGSASAIEVKSRSEWKKSYGDVVLGADKVVGLYALHKLGIDAFFVVELEGKVYFVRIDDRFMKYDTKWFARKNRKGSNNEGPCWRIPFGEFVPCPRKR